MALTVFAVLICLIPIVSAGAEFEPEEISPPPEIFGWSRYALADNYDALKKGDPVLIPALDRLIADAGKALSVEPVSVVDKDEVPPSGDKHDYMSIAIYWWPDPDTPDGLPWVNRDGEVNPDAYNIPDKTNKNLMQHTVETLALAYYFTGNEDYAAHAARHLRNWFINPATRMNPNLEYAQGIPGRVDGNPTGIIDTAQLGSICDCAILLTQSPHWTDDDHEQLKGWFREYLTWLTGSASGRTEGHMDNNHGVWYDAQVVHYALFCGEDDYAEKVARKAGEKRVASQIEPDGSMPKELRRTKSWDYSVYNLNAFIHLARVSRFAGTDLWRYGSEEGASIPKAIEFLVPYAIEPDTWEWKQIKPMDKCGQQVAVFLCDMASALNMWEFVEQARELDHGIQPDDRRVLYMSYVRYLMEE